MSAEAIASFIGAGVNFFALLFVAGQVAVANRQLRHAQSTNDADITRRKRQATIDYYVSTVEHRAELEINLPDINKTTEVHRFVKNLLLSGSDTKLHAAVNRYLDFYEAIAVAIAADVYDLEVFDAMDGGAIRDIVRGYKPYFERIRSTPETSSWYVELEWLASEIANLRGEENDYRLLRKRLNLTPLTSARAISSASLPARDQLK